MERFKLGIVAAPYHPAVRRMMAFVEGAVRAAGHAELTAVAEVAGSFEIPLAVKQMLKHRGVDGVITLGAIERGETGHGVALANAIFPALIGLGLEFEKPVGLGIIGPNATREQIDSRAERVAAEVVQAVIGPPPGSTS